jgi:hypothetical protein
VILLAAIFAFGLWTVLAPYAFLYRPIYRDQKYPYPPEVRSGIYLDQLEAIAPVIGKKVIFPPGLLAYASQEKLTMPGLRFFGGEFPWYHLFTVRDYLNQRLGILGLDWKYDAKQDAIIFDFAWHRPVSHSGQELVEQIGSLSPAPFESLRWDGHRRKLDPWRQALDELMSEPDNFPHAWKVRLQECCSFSGSMWDSTCFEDNIYSQLLKDTDGQEHLLVLNYRGPLTTKDRRIFAYYLFAADGKWEDGGSFEAGGPYCPPTVRFGSDQAIIEIDFKPLKLTNSATGEVTTLTSSLHIGDYLDYVLEIDHGKLAAFVSTNVSPLPDPLSETFGTTPLRHLGD